MQRIVITETDLTTNSVDYQLNDIVYIPGFSSTQDGAAVGVPVLCTSVSQFRTNFGSEAPKFATTQYYPYTTGSQDSYVLPSGAYSSTETYYVKDDSTTTGYNAYMHLTTYDSSATYYEYDPETDTYSVTSETVTSSNFQDFFVTVNSQVDGTNYDDGNYYVKTQVSVVTDGFMEVAIPVETTDGSPDYSTVPMFAAGDPDPSYQYALSLLQQGLSIVYERMNESIDPTSESYDVTVARAYTKMFGSATVTGIFSQDVSLPILDKGTYDIKYITTGGYPTFEYLKNSEEVSPMIIGTAQLRGDCVALIDHTNNPHRPLEGTNSVIKSAKLPSSSFGAMFTPWCNCTNGLTMPGSYVYLSTLAVSIKANPSWMNVAGVSRGLATIVSSLNTDQPLTNRIAESYQYGYGYDEEPMSCINAITFIRPYGYTIWGDRTLLNYSVNTKGFALSFLHLRNLVSEVKKVAYVSSQQVMFEVNNDILWTKFKSLLAPTLDSMVSANGLVQYKLVKVTPSDKTKLKCQIILRPTYNVESVNINVVLTDEDLEVTE